MIIHFNKKAFKPLFTIIWLSVSISHLFTVHTSIQTNLFTLQQLTELFYTTIFCTQLIVLDTVMLEGRFISENK